MKTSSKILTIIFAAVLMIAVLGSAAVSALCFKSVRTIGEAVEKTGAAVEQTGKAVEDTSSRVGEVSELVDELKERLARYMLPDVYVHLDEMPHTATMKLDRTRLRQMMRE